MERDPRQDEHGVAGVDRPAGSRARPQRGRCRRSRSPSSMSSWIRLKCGRAPRRRRRQARSTCRDRANARSPRRAAASRTTRSRRAHVIPDHLVHAVVDGSRSTTSRRISSSTRRSAPGCRACGGGGTRRMIATSTGPPSDVGRPAGVPVRPMGVRPAPEGWYRADVPGRRLYVTDAIVLSRFDFARRTGS